MDDKGKFTMTGVPPGTYKLFAWENIPEGAYQNRDFMRNYEDRGIVAVVPAGETVSPTVTRIPVGR